MKMKTKVNVAAARTAMVAGVLLAISFLLFFSTVMPEDVGASSPQSSDRGPNDSTACAIAVAPPQQQGSIRVTGPANMGCGGRSDSEIDSYVMERCSGCTIVDHFTHACAALSDTAGNNRSNTARGWAIVRFGQNEHNAQAMNEARRQANEKCTANGGIQCYVSLSVCDTGTYMQRPGSGGTTH